MPAPMVAVVGSGDAALDELDVAEAVGAGLARAGVTLVTGGLGGVMAAASRGAKSVGGLTVGLLPGDQAAAGNAWLDVAIPTGMGEGRNALVVRSAAAVVAVGGGFGTLSEIALALRGGTPVVGLGTWAIEGVDAVLDAASAVRKAVAACPRR